MALRARGHRSAGRNAFDLVVAFLVGHRREGVIEDPDGGIHPRMNRALDRDSVFLARFVVFAGK